jgi:hypothetical protein
MSTQQQWAQALLDAAQPTPAGLQCWNRSDPTRRLGVYRNNVLVSLVDALAQTFAVTQQLVGEAFFRAMAGLFVRAHPPRTPVLAHYGDALPSFIATFAPAAPVHYLSDVARLEWLRLQALHAADASPLLRSHIGRWLQDASALPGLRWQLHPSVQVLRSPYASVSLWAAHQPASGIALEAIAPNCPESALIFRSGLDVMVMQVDTGCAALASALLSRTSMGAAIEQAHAQANDFEASQAMALLIRHQLLCGVQPSPQSRGTARLSDTQAQLA